MPDYALIHETLVSLTRDVPHPLANLANASALLWEQMDNLNWAGFYLLAREDLLVLGPFQGKTACIEIPVGRGVCGTAVERGTSVVVPDVHEFPGHIACDSASESEIVVPIRKGGRIVGVLDLDSPKKNTFGEEDRVGLEEFVRLLEDALPDDFPAALL
ncbi:MAG: GAF domain-containing protein [Clostridia bacterium]|nr:GAF domain-containing protein [Clostridia bacterium]MBQ4351842.1 GAF domain-containing protein [Clostridia bacterium]